MFDEYLKNHKKLEKNNQAIKNYNKNLNLKIRQKNTKPLFFAIIALFTINVFFSDFLRFIAENWDVFEGRYVVHEKNDLLSIIKSFYYKDTIFHNLVVLSPFFILIYCHTAIIYFCYDNTHESKKKWFKLSKHAYDDGFMFIPSIISFISIVFLMISEYQMSSLFHGLHFFIEACLFLYLLSFILKKTTSDISDDTREFLKNENNEVLQNIEVIKKNILNNENEMRKIAKIKCLHSKKDGIQNKFASRLLSEFKSIHKQKIELNELNNDINNAFCLKNQNQNEIIND